MIDPPTDPSVELLYVSGCPNHDAFLPHLRHLLHAAGVTTAIRLVEITDADDAHRRRFLGSPTLRIDGADVDPSAADRVDYGLQCRLYRTGHEVRGTPPDPWILRALGVGVVPDRDDGATSG